MEKRFSYLLVFFFLLFINNNGYSETLKVSFVDIDKIISQSNAGLKIQKKIDKEIKTQNEKFGKIENDLKKNEEDILKQKNVISKEELDKKIKEFQTKLQNFRNERTKFNREIKINRIYPTKILN